MGSRSACSCWEIMQCDKSKNCAARENPQKPCWEIASETDDDYRHYFNICRDCIVYVLKTESSVLSNREIRNIMEAKTNCRLASKPKTYSPSGRDIIPPPPF